MEKNCDSNISKLKYDGYPHIKGIKPFKRIAPAGYLYPRISQILVDCLFLPQ